MEKEKSTVEDRLRSLIVTGEFAPTEWMREEALATRLGVSRTPIREACARLSIAGLLEHVPRRGFRLPAFDVNELQEIYPVVVSLEVTAIELLAGDLAPLVAKLEVLNFDSDSPPPDTAAYAELDYAWHHALVAATGNRVLLRYFSMLYAQLARFTHSHWNLSAVGASQHDHQMIADAIAAHDNELAVALVKSHRRNGLERICRLISGNDDK